MPLSPPEGVCQAPKLVFRWLMSGVSVPVVGQRLLSVCAAAEWLGVSEFHVRRLVWKGELPFIRIGRIIRIDKVDLERFVDSEKSRNGAAR
jgi:excisionase family DNA binding protein